MVGHSCPTSTTFHLAGHRVHRPLWCCAGCEADRAEDFAGHAGVCCRISGFDLADSSAAGCRACSHRSGNYTSFTIRLYDYPISHSLLTVLLWSLAVGAIYYMVTRYSRGAWIVGIAILSHWILDALVHRPDLPLRPGGATLVGLGLWNSWPRSIAAEVAIFLSGVILYVRSTCARDPVGRYAYWSLMAFLLLGWISSLLAGAPPSVSSLAWGGLSLWLLLPWAWWSDKNPS